MTGWTCVVITELSARLVKSALFVLLGLPAVWLAYAMGSELLHRGSVLGADPGEAVVLHLGQWTIRMLLLTLMVSPLARRLHLSWLVRARRMIGLWAFSYLCLHVLAYLGLLAEFDWNLVAEDFVERRYITAGLLALLALIPLAVTSSRGWQRRLGPRWRRLHRLIYPAVALGLVHLVWLSKDGYGEVVLYGAVFTVLMLERIHFGRKIRS
jgi:sulfoxide reductase heme-binding subunit YedZ